jgi:hypothetical protein
MLRRVALVRTDVSEELSASIIMMTRIGQLGTLAVTSYRRNQSAGSHSKHIDKKNTATCHEAHVQNTVLWDVEQSGSYKN